jgi:hypothetical protein
LSLLSIRARPFYSEAYPALAKCVRNTRLIRNVRAASGSSFFA